MTQKQKARAAKCNKGWAMMNCVFQLPVAATFAKTKAESVEKAKQFFDGAVCLGCKIVRVEIREL